MCINNNNKDNDHFQRIPHVDNNNNSKELTQSPNESNQKPNHALQQAFWDLVLTSE